MAKKELPEINASSLADIAFLLLTFFLIATSMDRKEGIETKIRDPRVPPPEVPIKKEPQNVLDIQLSLLKTEVLIEGQRQQPQAIKNMVKKHVTNKGKDPNFSDSPTKALIMIKTLKGTPFDTYLTAKNEVDRAYNEIWDELAKQEYNASLADLRKQASSADEQEATEATEKLKNITEGDYKKRIGEAPPEGG